MKVDRDIHNLTYKTPHNLKEVAEYHVDWLKLGADAKTARVIAFIQCLNANIVPFIIHIENKDKYEKLLNNPEKLEQLFKLEQLQFYRETEPMVIEQV